MRYRKQSGPAVAVVALAAVALILLSLFLSTSAAGDRRTPLLTAPVSKTAVERAFPLSHETRAPGGLLEARSLAPGTDIRTTVSTRPQNGPSIAADPGNPDIIVGAFNDYQALATGYAGNGVVYSHDGGATWTHSLTGVPLPAAFPDRAGDPSVEFDTQGRVYYGSLALKGFGSVFHSDNAILVARSTNGGITWPQVVPVVQNISGGLGVSFEDKPRLTVDHHADSPYKDRVYISWTRFYWDAHPEGGTGGGDIMVAGSADGGLTWDAVRLIVPGNVGTGAAGESFVNGSEPDVAPNGDLFVTFWFGGRSELWRSQDGGATFTQMTPPFGAIFGVTNVPSPLPNQSFRAHAFPNVETHPSEAGRVYVVAAADPTDIFGDVDDADILFATSADGGSSWDPPITLNDHGLGQNQIFPWIAVSKRGAIHVIWYDTRNDAANHDMDVYGTCSIDGGASFLPNVRVTDCTFDPDTDQYYGNSFFGDCIGLGSGGTNTFHALWTDSRTAGCPQVGGGEQEVYYEKMECEVAGLVCPPDTTLPAFTILPTLTLEGFTITNVSNAPMAFEYAVSTDGPGTLNDLGNPASLDGVTPELDPGQSYMPPDAGVDLPPLITPAIQEVMYVVMPEGNDSWADTCHTLIDIRPPLPVLFAAFEAHSAGGAVELWWDVTDAAEVLGYNVYRSEGKGTGFDRINAAPLPAGTTRFIDDGVIPGADYTYKIGALHAGGEVVSIPRSVSVSPVTARLDQNTPNPFNPATSITFVLPKAQHARVTVFDAQGKLVRTLFEGKGVRGENHLTWDGTNSRGNRVGSGVYYYRLETERFEQTRKMVFLK